MVIISQPLYISAVAMVKVSIIGVLGPFNIIANIVIARVYLHENIKFWEYIGIALFIPGTIITLMFSCMENHRYNYIQIHEMFYSSKTLTYLFGTVIAMVTMMYISSLILKINPGSNNDYGQQIDENDAPTQDTYDMRSQIKPDMNSERKLRGSFTERTDNNLADNQANEASTESLFNNPRLRFIPLLVYPYFGPFITSVVLIITR